MVGLQRIAASLAVAILAVGLASNGMAAPHKKRAGMGLARQAAMPGRSSADNGHDKVPFGSQRWWRIYEAQPKGR